MDSIAFIGTGNMASAIIGGLIADGVSAESLTGTTHSSASAERASRELGIRVTTDNDAAIAGADVVVLGVKPQMLADVCRAIAPAVQAGKPLVVSIAAGIEAGAIARWLNADLPMVRCMPNTPSLVGTGVSGLYANEKVTARERELAERMFSAVGQVHWVDDEQDLHLITAICGSAPAYFYRFAEALAGAAVQRGMGEETARALVGQVALGAARMMTETGETPGELRRRVTSPGGTTEQALQRFDAADLDAIVNEAVDACIVRSRQLSDELGNR